MGNQRVIYDSEAEDDGLSPVNSPIRDDAPSGVLTADHDNDQQPKDRQTVDSRSTDPGFFNRIYEEQQKTAPAWVLDSMKGTQAPEGFSEGLMKSSEAKSKDNSSSLTDPTLKSAKKRRLGTIATKDFSNLTQVTTPSAPSAKKRDVYDFHLSDEEGAYVQNVNAQSTRKSARSISKRKRGSSADVEGATAGSPQLPKVAHAFDDKDKSPKRSSRKRINALDNTSRHAPDDVDLLVMPDTAEMPKPLNEMQRASNQQPPASFFIEPPDTLTSSQKQKYLRVSGCSEPDGEHHSTPPGTLIGSRDQVSMQATGYSEHYQEQYEQQASLPRHKTTQISGLLPTSGSLSTIAYTTPSQYRSSIAPLPILGTADGSSSNVATTSARKSHSNTTQVLSSSPDELSTNFTGRETRGKRHMSDVREEDELAHHDSWDSDKIGYSRETYVPTLSRRRSVDDQEGATGTQAEVVNSATNRNRQTNGKEDETPIEDSWDSDNVGFPRERYAPRPSRRRSRAVVEDDDDLPDTCPPGDVNQQIAEVAGMITISSGQELPQQSTEDIIEGVDPEYWAAIPEVLRQEIRSQYTSQASRTRRSGRVGEESSSLKNTPEQTARPKKRGRKKKEPTIEEEAIAEEPSAAFEEPDSCPSPAPTATGKRKRGRPKKTKATQPPPRPENDDTTAAMETSERILEAAEDLTITQGLVEETPQNVVEASEIPKAPAKRGRKKKVVEEPAAALTDLQVSGDEKKDEEDRASTMSENRQALRDISHTANNTTSADDAEDTAEFKVAEGGITEKQQEGTPEPKAKEVLKSASTPGQQGKAPLRVGLSKKSRIPSLLKIIRK